MYVFAVDSSPIAFENGSFKASCLSIRSVLSALPGVSSGARAGIITFGAAIQFYRMKRKETRLLSLLIWKCF